MKYIVTGGAGFIGHNVVRQLKREPLPAPQLWLNPHVTDITKFTMSDIRLDGYTSHPPIKAEMAV
jgi:thymidylate synthase